MVIALWIVQIGVALVFLGIGGMDSHCSPEAWEEG
jgi:hypothetical protein